MMTKIVPCLQPDNASTACTDIQEFPFGLRRKFTGIHSLGCAIAIWGITAIPGIAADRLLLRFGPLEKTIEVEEIENFVDTGEIPESLQFLSILLTPQLQNILASRLNIDPEIVDSFLDELLNTPDGKWLMEELQKAIPNSSVAELRAALYLTLQQADGVSVTSFLRAYPQETLTIDASAAVKIALQLNASNLQSQALSPVVKRELAISPEEIAAFVPSFDPTQPGTERVRQRSLILRDRDRDRRIPIDLYYARETRGPLVVLSHGFAADRRFLAYVAHHLASHGFSTVALEHPGSSIEALSSLTLDFNPTDVLPAEEFLDRPKDVSFVLNELERLGKNRGYLGNKFDPQQAIVIGHSLGGYTALALAGAELDLRELRSFCQRRTPLGRSPADWLQCSAAELPHSKLQLRDDRVVSVMVFNPLVGKLFGDTGLERVQIPILIGSSSKDVVTPPLDHQLHPFNRLSGEKYFVSAIGATHMSITDPGNLDSVVAQSSIVQELMGKEAEPVRQLVRGLSLAWVNQLSDRAIIYRPFLSAAYVQSLSTPDLTMRFSRELPTTLNLWMQVVEKSNQPLVYQDKTEEQAAFRFFEDGLTRVKGVFRPPAYCTAQLKRIFTKVLSNEA
jgi:predicted dienelactone hydrolase